MNAMSMRMLFVYLLYGSLKKFKQENKQTNKQKRRGKQWQLELGRALDSLLNSPNENMKSAKRSDIGLADNHSNR